MANVQCVDGEKTKCRCSLCRFYIDGNEILRSIALIGAGKTSEYVICENCFLRLASELKDYAENRNLKRIIKGQVYYGSQLDEKGRVTLSTMLDERAIH